MSSIQNKDKIVILFGVLITTAGFSILVSNYVNEKIDKAYSYMNQQLLENETVYVIEEEVENIIEESTSSNNIVENAPVKKEDVYYIGTLTIPKINLNRGFTSIDSPYNTVNKNIEVIKGSTYPNVVGGNFILAAHSGNSYLAYFKDLYKLNILDQAYITYNNVKYTYQIVDIYQQEKTGQIGIYRDYEKTCLTLVTCTKDSKTKQTVYILELIDHTII